MKALFVDTLKIKLKASILHVFLSGLVALVAAYLVFYRWFPYPYDEISGGRDLFLLVIWVDLCCGPLLTFVLVNNKKKLKELVVDLSLVALVQLAALFYGVYSVMLAKPMFLVLEVDRFRVVALADVDSQKLSLVEHQFPLSYFGGPSVIAAKVPSSDASDFIASVNLSAAGVSVAFRPELWELYVKQKSNVLERAKPLSGLKVVDQNQAIRLDRGVKATGLIEGELSYLPMQGHSVDDWVVLLNKETAEVVGFAHVSGF